MKELIYPEYNDNPLYTTHKDKIVYLNSMGVDPEYRGQGIAKI